MPLGTANALPWEMPPWLLLNMLHGSLLNAPRVLLLDMPHGLLLNTPHGLPWQAAGWPWVCVLAGRNPA